MTVQLDSHGEDCWKVPSHYWCAAKKIEQLKAELQAKAGRVKLLAEMLDRHHICGYNTGNAAEPCLVCYAIHDAQDKEHK